MSIALPELPSADAGTHIPRSPQAPLDIQARLVKAVERKKSAYLWVPDDAITFVPRVLPKIYGDGRALFAIATINQRPAYWVIRACSTWGCGYDSEDTEGPDFGEMTDDILTDLEEAFGSGRCGYSGSSLFHPRKERIQWCKCEECADSYRARWPEVDSYGGCSWSRIDWPAGFETEPHPLSRLGNLLAASVAARDMGSRVAAQVEGEGSRDHINPPSNLSGEAG